MKTDDLISMLSKDAGPIAPVTLSHRLVPAGLLGGAFASLVIIGILGLVPTAMFAEPGPWIKLAYAGALCCSAAWLAGRLGKPGAPRGHALFSVLMVALLMMLAGTFSYLATPEPDRMAALMGHSWLVCPWAILGLSLPVMVGVFWAMKALAPTHLTLAGAACGLFAGAVAAMAYALACTEPAAPFIAIWYTLGMALSSALGAVLGPKVLAW